MNATSSMIGEATTKEEEQARDSIAVLTCIHRSGVEPRALRETGFLALTKFLGHTWPSR